jgi:hypothetical protein
LPRAWAISRPRGFLTAAGANVNDTDARGVSATTLAAHPVPELVNVARKARTGTRRRPASSALHAAIGVSRREDGERPHPPR